MKKILTAIFALMAFMTAGAQSQVDTLVVDTDFIVSPAKAVVAVPASYFNRDDATRYPVTYLLHGYGDDYRYYTRMDLARMADEYGMIFVCPDGRDIWYWDSPVKPDLQMESFITRDLVPAVDSLYRTDARASQRAIVGLSMGGHGALWLAIRHSDIWKNAGSMSGGVDITRPKFHKSWKMKESLGLYASNPARWKSHSVINLVPELAPGQINMMIACGTEDFFYEVNCDLDAALNRRKIGHVFMTGPGNHSWNYWGKVIYPILDFFEENFDKER